MGEDKPITKYYHSIGKGDFQPLDEIKECEFEVKPDKSMSVENFCKNVLGIDYPCYRASKIISYDYIIANGMAVTKIYWSDGSTTTCKTPIDKADQYTGFMIAVAKYAMGNKNEATNAADYWINKRPMRIAKFREKVKAEEAEIKRITDKRRKRREQYRLRLAAIRRKEAYEAAKLANEKYGVPLNFKEDGEDK